MTSNFQALTRNKAHVNLVAWYSAAVLTQESVIIYARDDSNRDLLIEIEGPTERALALIQALSKNKFLQPFVASSAHIWYYEHQRQLCASIPSSSQLGIAFRIPERSWKFDVLTTRSLATWEPKDGDDERSDFFVFRTPEPESWILKTANNGNTYSQVVFKVPTGKVSLQVWHRLAAEDVPQLASPQKFATGTRVALTNINLKLMGHATLAMNTTCWSVFVKLEDPLLPPEVLGVDVNTLDVVPQEDGLTRGVEETPPTDTMWVVEGFGPQVAESAVKSKPPKGKTKVKKSGHKKQDGNESSVKESISSQKQEVMSSQNDRDDGAIADSLERGTKGRKVTSPKITKGTQEKEMVTPVHALKLLSVEETAPEMVKKVPVKKGSNAGTPLPEGKKGNDFLGNRATVKGRGEGVIMGGGAVKVRIMFDVDAPLKTESVVNYDKVFLL